MDREKYLHVDTACARSVGLLDRTSLAVTFILGFLARPMGVVGMLFAAHLWLGLYRQPEEWPWLYVFLIFVQGFFVVTKCRQESWARCSDCSQAVRPICRKWSSG